MTGVSPTTPRSADGGAEAAPAEGQWQPYNEQIVERIVLKVFAVPMLESALHRAGTDVSLLLLSTTALLIAFSIVWIHTLSGCGTAKERRGTYLHVLTAALLRHAARWLVRMLQIIRRDEDRVRPIAAGVWAALWTAWDAELDLCDPDHWTALLLSFATASTFALALPVDISPTLLGIAEACGGLLLAEDHRVVPSYDSLMARAAVLTLATAAAHTAAFALERMLSALLPHGGTASATHHAVAASG